jgi:hypothetical protein
MSSYADLRTAAVDRHRQRLFGDAALEVNATTPEDGETIVGMFTDGWTAHRSEGTTDSGGKESGSWQFQLKALSDWETSQAFMLRVVSVKVGARRWKVKKVEKPIGLSLVWKINAEIQ